MKYALVCDLDRCSGCDSCVAACKHAHKIDLGVYRNRVAAVGPFGTYPDVSMYWLPMQCQQCENPGCIEVCPTGASYRDEETGIVLINTTDCIGCQNCLAGCPYDVRWFNAKTNTVDKCTLCWEDREADGTWDPACVHNCCTGARIFGDLDDAGSDAAKAIAAADPSAVHQIVNRDGTNPTAVYILSSSVCDWVDDPEEIVRFEK